MIFQYTWQQVMDGTKTQTSRIFKEGQRLQEFYYDFPQAHVYDSRDRLIYAVGNEYAIQPGRTKKAIGRLYLCSIERRDVCTYTDAEIIAEGFEGSAAGKLDFLALWSKMHDKGICFERDVENWDFDGTWKYKVGKESGLADDLCMLSEVAERPAKFYDAWKLTFKLVKDTP